jgi:hypothetical protein
MKKLLIAVNLLLLITCLSCVGCEAGNKKSQNKNKARIVKIEITDRTALHYCMNGKTVREKTITDPGEIKAFQVALDSMKEVQNMNIKYNFGDYDIILYFDDGTRQQAVLIYTIYYGVVFLNYTTNKYFKNNDVEVLIRNYF